MKRRIGLTGGTGFIGQYLIRDYGDQYEFVAITSRDDCSAFSPKARYVKDSYTREGFLRAFEGCEEVIHLGASIPEQVTEIGDMDAYYRNIASSEQLFMAYKTLEVKRIINISSVSVYGKMSEMPLKESMQYKPDSCYGISKATVEMLANMYGRKFGFTCLSLRVSQVLGYMRGRNNGFFSMLLNNACQGKEIPIYGQGKAARDYIYVRDVAGAIVSALETDVPSDVFNIGSGMPITNTELAEAYIAGIGSNSIIRHIDVEREDDRFWYLDTQKAQDLLHFTPFYSISDMARDMKHEMELAKGAP